jgi:hypothetical protein
MKLTKEEQIQERISELRFIAKALFVKGDYHNHLDLKNVADRLSSILEKDDGEVE